MGNRRMNIAILSVSLNVHSTRRIVQEAQQLGHYVELIDHTKCSVKLGEGKPKIFIGEEDITHEFDAVIPRIGAKVTKHGSAIVKHFEMNGVLVRPVRWGLQGPETKYAPSRLWQEREFPYRRPCSP